MAQHDFAPAWLNFPTPPSSTKPSLNCEKQHEPNVRLHNRSDVNHRRRNSSDGFESSNGCTGGGNFGRKEKNGWRGRNGSESVNSRGGYHGVNSRSRAGVFHSGKNQVLRESNSTRNENGKREEREARKQFEAEDFPSLNPESEREQNLSKSVAAGVWGEHPPNPKSRTSKMMVIKKVSKEDPSSGFPAAGPPHQQPTKNGTGLSVFKGLVPKPAAPPVKGSRSSSSSPVDKMTQPRLMKLTRVRSDKKSEFLKALKQDKVDEEDHDDRNQFKDDETLNMQNSNNSHRCRDENLNRYENEVPRVNGNALVIRSSTFPQADVLSSSLEAEHRLLKEMGWQEDSEHDETYAPLTEDEMREFQAISEQLQKNGLRKNGLSCDFKFGTWKNSTFKPTVDNDEAETSSSDTSDDDEM
ncbi:vasculin-like [Acipenser ruthenus]|uniref:vasculin-like n=1 Tax=Acipenser ruthenus TaxID=7906 RepID=UPI0027417440|nr:vasculin-like [Acipenser ruthenus]XP_058868707.1 vasculin-like [Acipenser ruthenus]